MIGDNVCVLLLGSAHPDRELYKRWMQLNAVLPVMQLSVPPRRYDQHVIDVARQMCELHERLCAHRHRAGQAGNTNRCAHLSAALVGGATR